MKIAFIPENYPSRQLALNDFSRQVKAIVRSEEPRTFNHEQVVAMLLELAKNTFDHSSGSGLLTLQMPADGLPVSFTYMDTGAAFDWEASSALGVSEKLGNGVNFGLGLAIVRQGALGAGFELSVEHADGSTQFKFKQSMRPPAVRHVKPKTLSA